MDIRGPKIRGDYQVVFKDEAPITFTIDPRPFLEQYMDASREFLGDGLSRMSATMDVSIKDFGCGVSASVTVSVSCGQDDANQQKAASFCVNRSLELAKWAYEVGEQQYFQMLAQRGIARKY